MVNWQGAGNVKVDFYHISLTCKAGGNTNGPVWLTHVINPTFSRLLDEDIRLVRKRAMSGVYIGHMRVMHCSKLIIKRFAQQIQDPKPFANAFVLKARKKLEHKCSREGHRLIFCLSEPMYGR